MIIASPAAVPPPASLAAAPARLVLPASSRAVIRVANTGGGPLDVYVSRAGLSLGGEGRPVVGPQATPPGWLLVSRTRFRVRAHATALLAVRSGLLRGVRPGDHSTLLLLSAVRPGRGAVAVSLRIGVVVVLRARGAVRRRLALGDVRVDRSHAARVLRVGVLNRGDLEEWLGRGRIRLILRRAGRVIARPAAVPRRMLARSSGVVLASVRAGVRGRCELEVRLAHPREGVGAVRRRYRVVL